MKKALITILSILLFVSFGLIGWYGYVYFFAPDKIVSETYLVGDQKILKPDGSTETKQFIELNVYDNVFEIKFNYMLDETKTAFYSQGLQYVLKDDKESFGMGGTLTRVLGSSTSDGSYSHATGLTWEKTNIVKQVWGDKTYSDVDKFNYMSSDNYETTLISTNPINEDTMFKIQLGDELYGMKFIGKNIDWHSDFFVGSSKSLDSKFNVLWSNIIWTETQNFMSCDVDYFSTILYEAVTSLNAGTNQICIFEFGDLFDYYKYDESKKQYSDTKVTTDEASKITADIKSYYSIKVSKFDGDMISSSQSLFNCYKGSSNYNVDLSLDDYFIGRNLVSVNVDKFDFIETETTGAYYLSLSEDFKSFYEYYKHLIEFEIVIDLDYLESLNIDFLGVVRDSLEDFKIYSADTIQLIDGEIVKGGINYV